MVKEPDIKETRRGTLPMVAIIGRPNVGKSTLFNRLIGMRLAVVDDVAGITRDRLVRRAEWSGEEYLLVDTGGWIPEFDESMDGRILEQVIRAIDACDIVIFLVDARGGMHPHDRVIARELRKRDLPVLLVTNKVDHEKIEADAMEFLELGWSPLYPVSAVEGRGVGDMLDAMLARIHEAAESGRLKGSSHDGIRVALAGRPNVGKSSLANLLLGEERMIVDSKPGTTRDAIDAPFRVNGRDLVLVDTAGLRRRMGSQPAYEFYAMLRSLRAIDRSDVAVLVLDATEKIGRQDAKIGSLIAEAAVGVVIAVNKWDLLEKDDRTMGEWVERIRDSLPFLSHAPILFISALTHQRIHKLPEAVLLAYDNAHIEIPTHALNETLAEAVQNNPPKAKSGQRPIKIYYATQVKTAPPTIALFVSEPARMAPEYIRYLAGRFRAAFVLEGSPLRVLMRKS